MRRVLKVKFELLLSVINLTASLSSLVITTKLKDFWLTNKKQKPSQQSIRKNPLNRTQEILFCYDRVLTCPLNCYNNQNALLRNGLDLVSPDFVIAAYSLFFDTICGVSMVSLVQIGIWSEALRFKTTPESTTSIL